MNDSQRAKLEEAATQTYCWSCRGLAIWILEREDKGNADHPNWSPCPTHLTLDDEMDRLIRENFDECPRRPKPFTIGDMMDAVNHIPRDEGDTYTFNPMADQKGGQL